MLHWLAGKPGDPDNAPGQHNISDAEPPDTPAPVFAIRAFKTAIFGTPQTVQQPKPRRNSNSERPRLRQQDGKSQRPGVTRPKSASDAQGLWASRERVPPDPIASPTKGILMTPGTAAAKRKTVTFGDNIADNEDKRPVKSGLPDDYPGKFPSPWTKPTAPDGDWEDVGEKTRGRSQLTEALEQVRDEAKKRKRRPAKPEDEGGEIAIECLEPKAECCKYWKTEYDVYRENSQREVRKLIHKQKAAKSFAREKDSQCTDLADQLGVEREKVDRLERRTAELEGQLRELREKIASAQKEEEQAKSHGAEVTPELAGLRSRMAALRRPVASMTQGESVGTAPDPQQSKGSGSAAITGARAAAAATQSTYQHRKQEPQIAPAEQVPSNLNEYTARLENTKPPLQPERAKIEAKPSDPQTDTVDDIWTQPLGRSSIQSAKPAENPGVLPNSGRTVTSGTGATPLKSLSVNTIPTEKPAQRQSVSNSPPNNHETQPPLGREYDALSRRQERERRGPLLVSPSLPQPSSGRDLPVETLENRTAVPPKTTVADAHDVRPAPVPPSSAFHSKTVLPPLPPTTGPRGPREQSPTPKTMEPPNVKENVAPLLAVKKPTRSDSVMPSAAWTAMSVPTAPAKRTVSVAGKDGKEVSVDRLEAAKARIAARGRMVS